MRRELNLRAAEVEREAGASWLTSGWRRMDGRKVANGELMVEEIVEGRVRNRDNILSQAALPDLKLTNADYNHRSTVYLFFTSGMVLRCTCIMSTILSC